MKTFEQLAQAAFDAHVEEMYCQGAFNGLFQKPSWNKLQPAFKKGWGAVVEKLWAEFKHRGGGVTTAGQPDLRAQVAWCWASGLIEIGDKAPEDTADGAGAIVIATGPRSELLKAIKAVARHGEGANAGKLLVPGVPEAENPRAGLDALIVWLAWCANRNSKQVRWRRGSSRFDVQPLNT